MTIRKIPKSIRINHSFSHFDDRSFLTGLLLILLIIIFLTACKSNKTTDPLPQTTTTSPATNNENNISLLDKTTPFMSTAEPKTTVIVDTKLYTHPQGYFSLQVPQKWLIEEDNNRIGFIAPPGGPKFEITVINTGYNLNNISFSAFIEIQEVKKASELKNYIEIEKQINPSENSILLTTEFHANGDLIKAATFYLCDEFAVVIAELIVNESDFESYTSIFEILTSSINLDLDEIATLLVYSFDQAARHSNGYFSILVPTYWSSQRNESQYSLVETFISPDQNAIIQAVVYDDGKKMSKAIAGEFTLALLRNNYTRKITVTKDEVLIDGREKLTWHTKTDNYQGITSFSVHGSSLLVLTIMWSNDTDQIYERLLEHVFMSFEI